MGGTMDQEGPPRPAETGSIAHLGGSAAASSRGAERAERSLSPKSRQRFSSADPREVHSRAEGAGLDREVLALRAELLKLRGQHAMVKEELYKAKLRMEDQARQIASSESSKQRLEVVRLTQEIEGLKRQRTRLLEEQRISGQPSNAEMESVGAWQPTDELERERGQRREALEKAARLEIAVFEARAQLAEKDEQLEKERQARQDETKTVANLRGQVASLREVVESVDVSLEKVQNPDGTVDPARLVLELAKLALPFIEQTSDPNLAISRLEMAAHGHNRPPLAPGTLAVDPPLTPQRWERGEEPWSWKPMTMPWSSAAGPAGPPPMQTPPPAAGTMGWPPAQPPAKPVVLEMEAPQTSSLTASTLPTRRMQEPMMRMPFLGGMGATSYGAYSAVVPPTSQSPFTMPAGPFSAAVPSHTPLHSAFLAQGTAFAPPLVPQGIR